MNDKLDEILLITQEECAEVTQAISKIFRFGFLASHNDKTNRQHLEEELGDLMAMIELLYAEGVIDEAAVHKASVAKLIKLNKWSTYIRN